VLQVFKMKAPYYPYALPLAGRRWNSFVQ
jgi:hypothetical protein